MSSNTTECTIPAIGVRPPLLMLVIVRAMAPVAGIPPNIGEARLATPCATIYASTVIMMMATSEPGIFLFIFGIRMMTATLAIPTMELHRSAVEKLAA